MLKSRISKIKGFTLIEIMVSISIFAVIMLMVSSTIYSVFDANRKSQSLRSVMDNLNFSLEAMTRTIRFGKNYHCDITQTIPSSPRDCDGGVGAPAASSIAVSDSNNVQVIYELNNGRIRRSVGGQQAYVTSSDVTITRLNFYVLGSSPYSAGNLLQPRVIVVMSGFAGSKPTTQSSFNLQTTISQRLFDSQ